MRKTALRLLSLVLFAAWMILLSEAPVFALPNAEKEQLPTSAPNLNIMKVAHRGVKVQTPENTLPAIERAIEMGYDYVELDVRYSRDGVPVIFHDLRLSGKTSGFGMVSRLL